MWPAKDKKAARELDLLLARGRISGPTGDAIFEQAFRASRPQKSVRRWLWGLLPATGLAALLLIAGLSDKDRFGVKGSAHRQIGLGVTCSDGSPDRCPTGSKLVFSVESAVDGGHLVAYAVRVDGPRPGERILYFPGAGSAAVVVAARRELQVMSQAVVLGPEQAPGRYQIHLFLTERPLEGQPRPELAAQGAVARNTVLMEVIP